LKNINSSNEDELFKYYPCDADDDDVDDDDANDVDGGCNCKLVGSALAMLNLIPLFESCRVTHSLPSSLVVLCNIFTYL
jgi:hypothetical protein